MTELWQPVVGYEGLNEVSDQGRVRSLDGERWNGHRVHQFRGRILTAVGRTERYLGVRLSKDSKVKSFRIHELVAAAFLPPCPGERGRRRGQWHVDHIDDNPLNNKATNLQWLVARDNVYVKPSRQRNSLGQLT